MALNLKGKHFLKIQDFTKEEIIQILDTADFLKMRHKLGITDEMLKGKTLAMVFEKSSTRTRVSFEVGMAQLGGEAIHLSARDIQLGRGETIADTARVLSRYVDGIMIRTYGQSIVEELAKFSTVPIINGLTDEHHPCQVLADIQTIREKFHKLEGLKLAYVGDAANVANSLIEGCTKLGINISLACPKGYQPTDEVIAIGNKNCIESGAKLVVTESIEEAVIGADVLYTDIWVSMGKEDEAQKRFEDLQDYQINDKVVKMANKNCIVMHCLPAHRGEEITDDVIEGPHSVVFDEAENRLHAQKAIMALTMR